MKPPCLACSVAASAPSADVAFIGGYVTCVTDQLLSVNREDRLCERHRAKLREIAEYAAKSRKEA